MNKHTWKHNCPPLDLKVSSLKTALHTSSRSPAPHQCRPGAYRCCVPRWGDVTWPSSYAVWLLLIEISLWWRSTLTVCGGCVISLLCSVRCAHQALHYHGETVNCRHRVRRGKHEGEDEEALRRRWEKEEVNQSKVWSTFLKVVGERGWNGPGGEPIKRQLSRPIKRQPPYHLQSTSTSLWNNRK